MRCGSDESGKRNANVGKVNINDLEDREETHTFRSLFMVMHATY